VHNLSNEPKILSYELLNFDALYKFSLSLKYNTGSVFHRNYVKSGKDRERQ